MSALLVHCELDDWDYDPRYTEGACPICGTHPDGAPLAPLWLLLSRRVPWDMVFLGVLAVLLVVMAAVVIGASGLAADWHLRLPRSLHLPALPILPHLRLPHR